jgi:hypothetical protein
MPASWLRRLWGMLAERRGAVSTIMTLMLVPMVGAIGMATETSGWFFMQRAAQNAADAAVMAAASNGCDPAAACAASPSLSPTYVQEAKAMSASYGFADGASNAAVTAVDTATCPSPSVATNCYKVTITKKVPIALTTLVGYNGTTTVNGEPAVLVSASAIASAPVPAQDCVLTKTSFQTNGAPKFDAGGCYAYSDGTATCNGAGGQGFAGLGFTGGFVEGSDTKCNGTPVSTNAPDPFATTLASHPISGCTKVGSGGTFTAPATLSLSGTCYQVNGSLAIPAGGTTITTSGASGSILEISGGNLILNGNLTAAVGQGLTIVFTGASGATPGFITGSSTINFGAPTTGPWSGVALYQDPATGASSPSYGGNSPTFDITGLIYAPNANMAFIGAINHETGGYACIAFIVNTLTIKGTGSIFANPTSQCYRAGLSGLEPAPDTITVRQALVQ